MSQKIKRINPSKLPDSQSMGYSQISTVEAGRMAFISGQVAWQADGSAVPKDVAEQVKIAAKNALIALEELNVTPEDIIIARCYVTDLTPDRLEQIMPPLLEMFDGAQPSVTGVGVAALASPDLQVEIELTVSL